MKKSCLKLNFCVSLRKFNNQLHKMWKNFEQMLKQQLQQPDYAKADDIEETPREKSLCACSYDPHSHTNETDTCSVKLALRNHVSFPSFAMMTEYEDPSLLYYEMTSGCFRPCRHWATLIEIERDISFVRPGCIGWNQFGERICVHFYHEEGDEPKPFNFNKLKAGNTLAILYPSKKQFMDMTEGIRQEVLNSCFIFEGPLKLVQDEAQKLLNDADIETPLPGASKQTPACFGCGSSEGKTLSRCSACKMAKYCSKVFDVYILLVSLGFYLIF